MTTQTTSGFITQFVKIHFTRHEFNPKNAREAKSLLKKIVEGKQFRMIMSGGNNPDGIIVLDWKNSPSELDAYFNGRGWIQGSWKRFVFVDVVESVEQGDQSASLI